MLKFFLFYSEESFTDKISFTNLLGKNHPPPPHLKIESISIFGTNKLEFHRNRIPQESIPTLMKTQASFLAIRKRDVAD